MFSGLAHYQHILVSGPQRSGTRIAAHMIAADTGHRYVDEEEFGVNDLDRLELLLAQDTKLVVQCPGLCHALVNLQGPSRLIVMMIRLLPEIYASQERIQWGLKEKRELSKYYRTEGRSAEVKYAVWLTRQRPQIAHWLELEYSALVQHPLWVPDEMRRSFKPDQWSIG